jgi:uncharacterized protein (TIGR02266 family)
MGDRNRRRNDRVPVSITGNLRTNLDPRYTAVMMANLSLGGAFVKTPYPLPVSELVQLEIPLPTRETPVRLTGEVVWTREDSELTGMGIRFTEISPEDLGLIRQFITVLSRDGVLD